MTETDPLGARLAVQNAQFALQKGQTVEARRLAMEAAQLDPSFEDPWLILASLSSPQASVAYLQRALDINPQSARATKGMQWALERLASSPNRDRTTSKHTPPAKQEPARVTPTQPTPAANAPAPTPAFVAEEKHSIGDFHTDKDVYDAFREEEITRSAPTKPAAVKPPKNTKPQQTKATRPAKPAKPPKETKPRKRSSCLLLILILLVCVALLGWVAMPSITAMANSFSAPLPADLLDKPTLTFTSTATATFTPIPTATNTPTPEPTNTPRPTDTPWPTNTPWPTSVPQDTNVPSSDGNNTEDFTGRWIDVNLSQQMLYAYEDNTIVNSFPVSTGVAAHPTVTGQYYIYVKYTSTLMTGPGYYLPNVPYTMYFYEGYGIHGTYWHNNFGHPMSHGCINMYTPDAEWMFNWASIGTLVNIHY
jgi:lipoprotein-anchoring transpeptidase ErfK/SrfK